MFITLFMTSTLWVFHVFAQTTTTSGAGSKGVDWISYILNGGPFAIVVLLLILDKLSTPGERDRLRIENAQLREEIKTLNANIRDEIVPPLVQLNTLMKDVIQELTDIRRHDDLHRGR